MKHKVDWFNQYKAYSLYDLLVMAYDQGRTDERKLCQDIAAKVRKELGW